MMGADGLQEYRREESPNGHCRRIQQINVVPDICGVPTRMGEKAVVFHLFAFGSQRRLQPSLPKAYRETSIDEPRGRIRQRGAVACSGKALERLRTLVSC